MHDQWEHVQALMHARNNGKPNASKRDFAFAGLMRCGYCDCAMTAQFQKGRLKTGKYVYYHCTGYKAKCPGRYVREELVTAEFTRLLDSLTFDDEVMEWFRTASARAMLI